MDLPSHLPRFAIAFGFGCSPTILAANAICNRRQLQTTLKAWRLIKFLVKAASLRPLLNAERIDNENTP